MPVVLLTPQIISTRQYLNDSITLPDITLQVSKKCYKHIPSFLHRRKYTWKYVPGITVTLCGSSCRGGNTC